MHHGVNHYTIGALEYASSKSLLPGCLSGRQFHYCCVLVISGTIKCNHLGRKNLSISAGAQESHRPWLYYTPDSPYQLLGASVQLPFLKKKCSSVQTTLITVIIIPFNVTRAWVHIGKDVFKRWWVYGLLFMNVSLMNLYFYFFARVNCFWF